MSYKSNLSRSLMLLCLLCLALDAQPPYVSIPRRAIAEQREFVKQYLAQGVPMSMDWGGQQIQAGTDFAILVANNTWVQSELIVEIDRVKALPGDHNELLTRLGVSLSVASNPTAFEVIRTRFREHPKYEWIMQDLIHRNLDAPTSYPFSVLYLSLESDEPRIRAIALKMVKSLFEYGPQRQTLEAWASGLRHRYNGVPTDLQLLTDPVAEVLRMQDAGKSVAIIPYVKAIANAANGKSRTP